ncbi:MAG: phosphomannose isomerase type II C-terminal cupin domain [Akkermansia sp.]|nr:phosphomannose isomerase type II C-terminal cupin domain [Akkermansia sp.]MBQ7024437.1 phosphomannose isomerase type II C-terminal cupin domain [Akkermansia sp.]
MKESYTTYKVGEQGERPWGRWQVLDLQSHVVVKKLLVVPGGRISLQRHNHRTERWIVTEGVATVRLDDVVTRLKVGQSIMIPCGSLHRLSNDGDVNLALIEIQIGDFLSEDDIERFKDDYGRVE